MPSSTRTAAVDDHRSRHACGGDGYDDLCRIPHQWQQEPDQLRGIGLMAKKQKYVLSIVIRK
jgi:hypothetical protein